MPLTPPLCLLRLRKLRSEPTAQARQSLPGCGAGNSAAPTQAKGWRGSVRVLGHFTPDVQRLVDWALYELMH